MTTISDMLAPLREKRCFNPLEGLLKRHPSTEEDVRKVVKALYLDFGVAAGEAGGGTSAAPSIPQGEVWFSVQGAKLLSPSSKATIHFGNGRAWATDEKTRSFEVSMV